MSGRSGLPSCAGGPRARLIRASAQARALHEVWTRSPRNRDSSGVSPSRASTRRRPRVRHPPWRDRPLAAHSEPPAPNANRWYDQALLASAVLLTPSPSARAISRAPSPDYHKRTPTPPTAANQSNQPKRNAGSRRLRVHPSVVPERAIPATTTSRNPSPAHSVIRWLLLQERVGADTSNPCCSDHRQQPNATRSFGSSGPSLAGPTPPVDQRKGAFRRVPPNARQNSAPASAHPHRRHQAPYPRQSVPSTSRRSEAWSGMRRKSSVMR